MGSICWKTRKNRATRLDVHESWSGWRAQLQGRGVKRLSVSECFEYIEAIDEMGLTKERKEDPMEDRVRRASRGSTASPLGSSA